MTSIKKVFSKSILTILFMQNTTQCMFSGLNSTSSQFTQDRLNNIQGLQNDLVQKIELQIAPSAIFDQPSVKEFSEEEIIANIMQYAKKCITKKNDINIYPKITNNASQEEKEHVLTSFLKQYEPPKDIIPLLDDIIAQPQTKNLSHNDYIVKNMKRYCSVKIIESTTDHSKSNFFVKNDINRLFNAICLKAFIEKNELISFDVAKKYIYYKNNQCLIVAENIEEDTERTLNHHEIMQLLQISLKTGFCDWNNFKNVITAKNGKIIFIDTEDKSFSPVQKNCCTAFCVWNLTNKLLNSCPTNDDINLNNKFSDKVRECQKNYANTGLSSSADIKWHSEKFNYYNQHDLPYIYNAIEQYQNKQRELPDYILNH